MLTRIGKRMRMFGGKFLLALLAWQAVSVHASLDSYAGLYGQLRAIESTIRGASSKPGLASGTTFVPSLSLAPKASRFPSLHSPVCGTKANVLPLVPRSASSFTGARLPLDLLPGVPREAGPLALAMSSTAESHPKRMMPSPRDHEIHDRSPATSRSKVLVLNASYEPIAIISACRALALLWTEKASLVIPRERTWTSCGGQSVTIPSVVSLRRYVKVRPRTPPPNRRTILLRDEGVCQYCGRQAENVDHVIPRSKGGLHRWDNVVACCKACNSRKADKFLKDLDMKLKRPPAEPTNICWVHNAVWKVEPCWRPYVGSLLWEDLHAKLPSQKASKRQKRKPNKHKKKTPKSPKAAPKASKKRKGGSSEADSVIAAYTKPE